MKNIYKILLLVGILIALPIVSFAVTAFNSAQVGSSPTNGYLLQTNGSISTWVSTTTLGLSGSGGVTSFNTRTGAVTLSSSDVTTALTFTPYNATNPSGYISNITGLITQGTNVTITGAGTAGTPYTINATNAGTVTSVATNNGLTGGTITSSGTIGLNTTGLSTNAVVTWNGSNLVATGTPQLTVGNIIATSSTATSTIAGPLQLTNSIAPLVFPDNSTSTSAGVLIAQDNETANTSGGASVAGKNTRVLNTVVVNTISGASLSSNQVILPAGTFCIEAQAPDFAADRSKAVWFNVTDNATTSIGTNGFSDSGTGNAQGISFVNSCFTTTAQKTFTLLHYFQSPRATNGQGLPANLGMTEVYAQIYIRKI